MPRMVPRTSTDVSALALQTQVDDLETRLTAVRAAAMDELLTTGLLVSGTDQVPLLRPFLADPVFATADVTAWTLGAWAELIAAAVLASHSLIGLVIRPNNPANPYVVVEIGVGAAAAEVVVYRTAVAHHQATAAGNQNMQQVSVWPPVQITANGRVAVRTATQLGANGAGVYGIFLPRPF